VQQDLSRRKQKLLQPSKAAKYPFKRACYKTSVSYIQYPYMKLGCLQSAISSDMVRKHGTVDGLRCLQSQIRHDNLAIDMREKGKLHTWSTVSPPMSNILQLHSATAPLQHSWATDGPFDSITHTVCFTDVCAQQSLEMHITAPK
jgi:hypothetical protein